MVYKWSSAGTAINAAIELMNFAVPAEHTSAIEDAARRNRSLFIVRQSGAISGNAVQTQHGFLTLGHLLVGPSGKLTPLEMDATMSILIAGEQYNAVVKAIPRVDTCQGTSLQDSVVNVSGSISGPFEQDTQDRARSTGTYTSV